MTDLEHQKKMLHRGRKLFGGSIDFVMGAVSLETLPAMDRPEVTFAGRSNVGKSSLINALTKRKDLARTSNTPGRTQELNYFKLGEENKMPVYMVDLPGYGYAKVSKERVRKWTHLVKTYLTGRANLRRIFLLIDSRHGIKPINIGQTPIAIMLGGSQGIMPKRLSGVSGSEADRSLIQPKKG